MTNTNTLSASKRDDTGKGVARKLRANGRVPAVLYGKDMEALTLSVDAHEALRLFEGISVENTIVDLDVGEDEPVRTLVREIQMHAYRPEMLHVDFLRIQKGVAVDVDIPVRLVGMPIGVKMSGGTMEQIIHEIPVRCIPSKIPESLEVDVSGLDLGESLHVSDVVLPDDVEMMIDVGRTLCSVAAPRAEIEETEEGEEEGLEPEMVDEADPAEDGEADSA